MIDICSISILCIRSKHGATKNVVHEYVYSDTLVRGVFKRRVAEDIRFPTYRKGRVEVCLSLFTLSMCSRV